MSLPALCGSKQLRADRRGSPSCEALLRGEWRSVTESVVCRPQAPCLPVPAVIRASFTHVSFKDQDPRMERERENMLDTKCGQSKGPMSTLGGAVHDLSVPMGTDAPMVSCLHGQPG